MTLAPGARVSRYEILALVGSGGMGEVYRAQDPRLGRQVAIKVLPAAVTTDTDRLRRFEQEARAAAALNHPNIVAVYDVGTDNGQPFIVSELLDGQTLRAIGAGPGLPSRQIIQYALEMCRGLAAAHDRGIVHRDLKPDNVIVTRDGRLKILDFGLAKLTETPQLDASASTDVTLSVDAPALTAPNVILGTIGYMSPEQICGRAVDRRSDIFSAGAMLYELCSGHRPFARSTPVETVTAVLKDQPAKLTDKDLLSAGLHQVIGRCLEKEPADRFQSARDVAFTLETVLSLADNPASGRAAGASPSTRDAGGSRLIVLPFENVSGHDQDGWLGLSFADSLTFGLREVEHIIIVNRERSDVGADPRRLIEMLDLRYSVNGSFQRVGDDLKVVVRLVDVQTDAIVLQESVTDRVSNLLALQDAIADRFVSALHVSRPAQAPNRASSLAAYKRLVLAGELHASGRYAEAIRQLEVAVSLDARYGDAWALLANCYARMTSPSAADEEAKREFQEKALEAAERAVELDPSLYEAQIAVALAHRGVEEVDRWRAAALKAVRLNPRLAEAYVLLGQSYFASPAWGISRLRDRDLAEHYIQQALQLDPRFGLGHNALVHHLLWDGRPEEALKAADAALALLPDHIDLQRARATTLVWLQRVDEAEAQLGEVASESGPSAHDEWALAAVDLFRGRHDQAASRFRLAIARGPRVTRELDTALIYCRAGLFSMAAEHLESALSLERACARFVDTSGAFGPYRDHPAVADVLERQLS